METISSQSEDTNPTTFKQVYANPPTCSPAFTIFIAYLWLFMSSSVDSLSVFNSYVEQLPSAPASFHGAWSSSMSFICLAAMPTMVISGVVVGHPVHSTKTIRVRCLALFASFMYASLALAGLAVSRASPLGILLFVTTPGVGFGVFYVISLELLAACTPKHARLIVASGLMVFSFGVIIFADIFKSLIHALGVVNAVYASAALISIPLAITGLIIQWPSSEQPIQDTEEREEGRRKGILVHASRFPCLPVFWLFVITFLTLQAGAALYSYFLPIGMSFSKPIDVVIPYFQMGNLVGLLTRLPAAIFIDKMAFGTGMFAFGSKNVMLMLLVLQIMLISLMWFFSLNGAFMPFAICAVGMWGILSGSATAAPFLARDLFGERNGPAAFGIASSIAFGGGEFFAMYLISLVDKMGGIGKRIPSRYAPFYAIEVAASLIALVCCLALRRSQEAFPKEMDTQINKCGNFLSVKQKCTENYHTFGDQDAA